MEPRPRRSPRRRQRARPRCGVPRERGGGASTASRLRLRPRARSPWTCRWRRMLDAAPPAPASRALAAGDVEGPEQRRIWTRIHELVVRCPFNRLGITNCDVASSTPAWPPRGLSSTGFVSWTSKDVLDRWWRGDVRRSRTGVLYAAGH